jgi:hypothetical protein
MPVYALFATAVQESEINQQPHLLQFIPPLQSATPSYFVTRGRNERALLTPESQSSELCIICEGRLFLYGEA